MKRLTQINNLVRQIFFYSLLLIVYLLVIFQLPTDKQNYTMNTISDPRCPKCNSSDNFRALRKKKFHDEGFCRTCKKVTGAWDEFLIRGDEFDSCHEYEKE